MAAGTPLGKVVNSATGSWTNEDTILDGGTEHQPAVVRSYLQAHEPSTATRTGDPISENRNGAANSPVYRQLMATTLAERNDGTPLEWPRTNLAYLTNSFMGSSTGRWASPLPGQVTTDGP